MVWDSQQVLLCETKLTHGLITTEVASGMLTLCLSQGCSVDPLSMNIEQGVLKGTLEVIGNGNHDQDFLIYEISPQSFEQLLLPKPTDFQRSNFKLLQGSKF